MNLHFKQIHPSHSTSDLQPRFKLASGIHFGAGNSPGELSWAKHLHTSWSFPTDIFRALKIKVSVWYPLFFRTAILFHLRSVNLNAEEPSKPATVSLDGSCECCEWLIPGRCSQKLNCYSRLYGQFACKLLRLLSTRILVENTLYNVHWSNCKWPACNTSQRATNAMQYTSLHFWGPEAAILRESCCHICNFTIARHPVPADFPASSRLYLSNVLQARVEHGAQAFSCAHTVKQYTSSQINYEACLR